MKISLDFFCLPVLRGYFHLPLWCLFLRFRGETWTTKWDPTGPSTAGTWSLSAERLLHCELLMAQRLRFGLHVKLAMLCISSTKGSTTLSLVSGHKSLLPARKHKLLVRVRFELHVSLAVVDTSLAKGRATRAGSLVGGHHSLSLPGRYHILLVARRFRFELHVSLAVLNISLAIGRDTLSLVRGHHSPLPAWSIMLRPGWKVHDASVIRSTKQGVPPSYSALHGRSVLTLCFLQTINLKYVTL